MHPLTKSTLATAPIAGQKPGTSGLRKKTKVFMDGLYLHNFVQSLFDVLPRADIDGQTLVVSGDGRFWTREAIQIIIKIAAANGYGRVWVGQGGLLSTPAVSCVIREREGGVATGGIILTASHNPGGLEEDFGIKYNCGNGGPAPESVTDAIFAATGAVRAVSWCGALPDFDLDAIGATAVAREGGGPPFVVEVIDAVADYAALLQRLFDFPALRALVARPDFSMAYDGMGGVAGPYARGVLGALLGVPAAALRRCDPLPDFGGAHPDPNLTYAPELVALMGLGADGAPRAAAAAAAPALGAAQDGDADRNMILGAGFFVTPSDSVAVIAARAADIPAFARAGGLKGVARSMPTSGALDRVAAALGIPFFEVPTGWKFFGNLMDSAALGKADYCPFLCGEESFGTGSDHVREKDGLWAVLAWLSILAAANKDAPVGALVSVEAVVRAHWARFGRNYYMRYDYEGVDAAGAAAMMDALRAKAAAAAPGAPLAGVAAAARLAPLARADEFAYTDPVDGSVSARQGLRFVFADGARVVFRLSGTGSVGATVRVYIEKVDTARFDEPVQEALKDLVAVALELAEVEKHTGRTAPTVIT